MQAMKCRGYALAVAKWLASLSAAALCAAAGPQMSFGKESRPIEVGVYYFPGWRLPADPIKSPTGWAALNQYKDRIPSAGIYNDLDPAVLVQQAEVMKAFGVRYIAFDWYFSDKGIVQNLDSAGVYANLSEAAPIDFCLMWANHDNFPKSLAQWDAIVGSWISTYFKSPKYRTHDGKPVVIIFSARRLDADAKGFGKSAAGLIDRAQKIAHDAGLAGIYFAGGTTAGELQAAPWLRAAGFSAFTSYNFRRTPAPNPSSATVGYPGLDKVYQAQWKGIADETSVPLLLPLISGWDRGPWGGSPGEDNSISTPTQFSSHLQAALEFAKGHNVQDAVLCCWNEFGEGSFVEPTVGFGDSHLRVLAGVLAGRNHRNSAPY